MKYAIAMIDKSDRTVQQTNMRYGPAFVAAANSGKFDGGGPVLYQNEGLEQEGVLLLCTDDTEFGEDMSELTPAEAREYINTWVDRDKDLPEDKRADHKTKVLANARLG